MGSSVSVPWLWGSVADTTKREEVAKMQNQRVFLDDCTSDAPEFNPKMGEPQKKKNRKVLQHGELTRRGCLYIELSARVKYDFQLVGARRLPLEKMNDLENRLLKIKAGFILAKVINMMNGTEATEGGLDNETFRLVKTSRGWFVKVFPELLDGMADNINGGQMRESIKSYQTRLPQTDPKALASFLLGSIENMTEHVVTNSEKDLRGITTEGLNKLALEYRENGTPGIEMFKCSSQNQQAYRTEWGRDLTKWSTDPKRQTAWERTLSKLKKLEVYF